MMNEIEVACCEVCGKEIPDFKLEYCCNAFDCDCKGRPVNYPICSEECYDKLMEGEDE